MPGPYRCRPHGVVVRTAVLSEVQGALAERRPGAWALDRLLHGEQLPVACPDGSDPMDEVIHIAFDTSRVIERDGFAELWCGTMTVLVRPLTPEQVRRLAEQSNEVYDGMILQLSDLVTGTSSSPAIWLRNVDVASLVDED